MYRECPAIQQCAPGVFRINQRAGMQLKYFGSKAWLAPHMDRLLGDVAVLHSPFFGSGKLEYYLAARRAGLEVLCEGAPLSREAVAQQDVRAGGPAPGTASQRARQEAPGVEAPVHPAPHQAQQGAQEDRVSPQVAAVQVCDGLEGVDAGGRWH